MRKKQVPEGTVSREEQLRQLRAMLVGHEIFGRQRGKLGFLANFVNRMASEAKSPSDFCAQWRKFAGDLCVLGNMLAKFKRDGWDEAAKQLAAALTRSTHILPGETVALEETTPITLLMVKPEKTIVMIDWLVSASCRYEDLGRYAETIDKGQKADPETLEGNALARELTQRLFEAFPSLTGQVMRGWRAAKRRGSLSAYDMYAADNLLDAYQADVGKHYSGGEFNKACWFNLESEQYSRYLSLHHRDRFLWLFPADQRKVLSGFNREQQEDVATWYFDLPKVVAQARSLKVGFHPEEEHAKWQREQPALSSKGVACGFGATFFKTEEEYEKSHLLPRRGIRESEDEALRFVFWDVASLEKE